MERITEKDMEDIIAENPNKFLGETGLTLMARQYSIGNYRFDLLFGDRHGGKLIVELQRGALDREHMFKVLDYCDEYRERNPSEFVEPLIVANIIPHERKRRLSSRGVSFLEIPEEVFSKNVEPISPAETVGKVISSSPAHRSEAPPESAPRPQQSTNSLFVKQFTGHQNSELTCAYNNFLGVVLDRKIDREVKARQFLLDSIGKMTTEEIDRFFTLVDNDPTGPWFGPLLNRPNRNTIFSSPIEQLNELFNNLLSTRDMKWLGHWRNNGFRGLSYGVASLLLYISEPDRYYVWVPKSHEALRILGYVSFPYPSSNVAPDMMSRLYSEFNAKATFFRDEFGIHERSVDWLLWAIREFINNPGNKGLRAFIDGTVK